MPVSEGRIKPRYVNEIATAHKIGAVLPSYWPIPELSSYQLFFQNDAIRLLKEKGGDEVERQPWFDHAVGVMTFWRRQLDSKLGAKLATGLETSDFPKDESSEAWGSELAAAVIADAKATAEYEANKDEMHAWFRREQELREQLDRASVEYRQAIRDELQRVEDLWYERFKSCFPIAMEQLSEKKGLDRMGNPLIKG